VLVVALAAIAFVIVPGKPLPTGRPDQIWGEPDRPGTGASPSPPATPGGAPRQDFYVVEQTSPIVGTDKALVEALGIESPPGRFKAVLPKGTPVPVGRVVIFRTGADNQREIRLHIVRGNSENASEDHSLGWVRIADLPPGPRGATRVAVMFQVVDVAIRLAAQNPESGTPLLIEASEQPPGFGQP